jgi:hypothetical protein
MRTQPPASQQMDGRRRQERAIEATILCYELSMRFDKEGPAGLEPRFRRPLSSPGQVAARIEQRICRLRERR